MRRFLTASHGPLSQAILRSAGLIAGEETFHGFRSISVTMSDSRETVMGMIDEIFSQYDPEDEIVAITDVFGGSITNALTEYITTRKLHIIAGMNLGLVLEAGFSDESVPVEELVKNLQQVGHEQILYVNDMARQENMEDEI
jgi:mannose/fructose-specific phosphotransferase system component IIA